MSADDTLTLEPTPPPQTHAFPADPEAAAALARGRLEAARRQQSLRSEYLRAVAHEAETRAAASRAVTRGAIFLVIGLVITLATYSHASSAGGMYVVAWGPVVYGLVQIVRGLSART